MALEATGDVGQDGQDTIGQRGPRKRRNPLVRIVLVLAWLGVVPVTVATLAAFWLPLDLDEAAKVYLNVSWVAFMVRTFSFHAAAALAVAAVVAGVLRAPRLCILAVAATGLTVMHAGGSPAAGTRRPAKIGAGVAGGAPGADRSADRGELRVMTCNLWAGLTDVSRVVAEIEKHDPDVVCFQEYTHEHDRMLQAALRGEYVFAEADPQRGFSGMATYSRLPMRRESGRLLGPRGIGPVDPVDWERQLCCVIEVGVDAGGGAATRDVVIQNIHLPTAPMGRALLSQHRRMVGQIRSWLRDETRPVVLAGDFNCTPMSAEAGVIRSTGLIDAHRAVGTGLGTTWGKRLAWPGFRIDHVYSRGLTPQRCVLGQNVGSDHWPVVAELQLE